MFLFSSKQYPEKVAILILIVELFISKVLLCIFIKIQVNFQYILLFLCVCRQIFHISRARISEKVKGVLKGVMKSSVYCFYVKSKISVKFHICISLPLRIVMYRSFIFVIFLGYPKSWSQNTKPEYKLRVSIVKNLLKLGSL